MTQLTVTNTLYQSIKALIWWTTCTATSLCHSSSRNVPPSLSHRQFCFSSQDSHFHLFQRPNSPFCVWLAQFSVCTFKISDSGIMMHAKSDSDVTSLAPSSPRSPKRPVYFVQSPSRDSNDGDKSSTMHATPAFNSPMESPSHPSYGRHSRASSASRVSGTFKGSRKRSNDKGWPECKVIEEEGDYNGLYGEKGFSRRCQILMALLGFVVIFSIFCLILWGASRPYKARVTVKVCSLMMMTI